MIVLWMLVPVLVFNEILLGQRVPRTTYFCIKCNAPWVLRQYLRCPACGTFHHGLLWARGNAFGHWFGLFCPDCGARIPTLLSVVSIVVAAVTAPFWYPLWLVIRQRWVAWEQRRAVRQRDRGAAEREPVKNWLLYGTLAFGGLMWLTNALPRYLFGRTKGNLVTLFVELPVCLGTGALFGLIMKWFLGRRHRFQAGHCRSCGYDLRGLPSNVCPECGFRFDNADLTGGQT
jgi:DNA-directed RNA polymerase subunit RPC12/RpoP